MFFRISLIAMSLLVLLSAIGVVSSRHESRKLFVFLQEKQEQRDHMNVEWGKLQIEQSTWATHTRVANKAASQLGMLVPKTENVRMIENK